MPDYMIPEESEELHKKLIPFLRRGFHDPVTISPPESSQIIAQVRDRLIQAEYLPSETEKTPVQQQGQMATSSPLTGVRSQKSRIPRFINILAAVLVVGILIGTSLLLLRPHTYSPAAIPTAASTGPSARTQVNGLEASIHLVTPGPYFLSELLFVEVSLTNHTSRSFMLSGLNKPDSLFCPKSALSARITRGNAPSYTFPLLSYACNDDEPLTNLARGQTLTIDHYLPMTRSGEVTITMGGQLMGTMSELKEYSGGTPLDGHWPFLRIHVDPKVPPSRMISLHVQGTQIMVQAPQAARAHLLYMESITCGPNTGLYVDSSGTNWTPLTTTALSQPACPTTVLRRWDYIVSAPGYPIVSGSLASPISSAKYT